MFEGLSFVTMATNLPSYCFIQLLEQLLKFLVNFILLKYVKSQRSYAFLITKELIFGFQILDIKDHFSASLNAVKPPRCKRYIYVTNRNKRSVILLTDHFVIEECKLCSKEWKRLSLVSIKQITTTTTTNFKSKQSD